MDDAVVSIPGGPFRLNRRRYAAGLRQPPHAHEEAQMTILLAGRIREIVSGREEFGTPLSVVVKPPGVRHADEIGPSGARTFQIAFPPSAWRADAVPPEVWRWIHAGPAVRTMLALAKAVERGIGGASSFEDRLWDAVGAVPTSDPIRRDPGAEIRRVRERIDDEPGSATVAVLARQAGLHPASLTRAFRRSFGVSVVAYRTGRRFRRAAAAIAARAEDDLTRIALDSGYADHAHLTRDFRRRSGLTPSEYRRIARG
jgi:AraC family transcriptional regulator